MILHQEYAQELHPVTDGYPAACMPIANKPLISYQIKYLESNNQFDIYIVVPSNNYVKIERYLLDHFDADPRSNIFVVVVLEEETRITESANALKMMASLHTFQQEKILNLPKYEQEVYRKEGTKKQMDFLNFDKETVIVMEGTSLVDVPLAPILVDHKMTDSSLTAVLREVDLTVKSKVPVKIETHEIFAYSDLDSHHDKSHVKRLVIKTDN